MRLLLYDTTTYLNGSDIYGARLEFSTTTHELLNGSMTVTEVAATSNFTTRFALL